MVKQIGKKSSKNNKIHQTICKALNKNNDLDKSKVIQLMIQRIFFHGKYQIN